MSKNDIDLLCHEVVKLQILVAELTEAIEKLTKPIVSIDSAGKSKAPPPYPYQLSKTACGLIRKDVI